MATLLGKSRATDVEDVLTEAPSMKGAEKLLSSLMALNKEAVSQSTSTRPHTMKIMKHYADALNLDLSSGPAFVHVAGTKGKGSTCAFTEAILRQFGYRTGLFTSPHLVHLRERIRLDGEPMQEDQFVKALFETYERLYRRKDLGVDKGIPPMPSFFRFLTLLALSVFAKAKVDVVVLEVGIGGRLDATNVIPSPVVCGIALIDFDHVAILGDTLAKIAREKAGILKSGCAAFTVEQEDSAMLALKDSAEKAKVDLVLTSPKSVQHIEALGIPGHHQYTNASLAASLAFQYVSREEQKQSVDTPTSWDEYLNSAPLLKGLRDCRWPGRCQTVRVSDRLTFYVDCAHTASSIVACRRWYREAVAKDAAADETCRCVLFFNCGQDRNPYELLGPLSSPPPHGPVIENLVCAPFDLDKPRSKPPPSFESLKAPDECKTGVSTSAKDSAGAVPMLGLDNWQHTIIRCWRALHPGTRDQTLAVTAAADAGQDILPSADLTDVYSKSVAATVEYLADLSSKSNQTHFRVLVTGSVYLAGNVLNALSQRNKTNAKAAE